MAAAFYKTKLIHLQFFDITTRIILHQNERGQSLLQAICNLLLLRGNIELDADQVSQETLLSLVEGYLSKINDNLPAARNPVITLMKWLLPVEALNLAASATATPGSEFAHEAGQMTKKFLGNKSGQLKPYGFSCVEEKDFKEGEFGVLLCNNQFQTTCKYKGELYALLTEQQYIEQREIWSEKEKDLVWERVAKVDGERLLMTGDFKTNIMLQKFIDDQKNKAVLEVGTCSSQQEEDQELENPVLPPELEEQLLKVFEENKQEWEKLTEEPQDQSVIMFEEYAVQKRLEEKLQELLNPLDPNLDPPKSSVGTGGLEDDRAISQFTNYRNKLTLVVLLKEVDLEYKVRQIFAGCLHLVEEEREMMGADQYLEELDLLAGPQLQQPQQQQDLEDQQQIQLASPQLQQPQQQQDFEEEQQDQLGGLQQLEQLAEEQEEERQQIEDEQQEFGDAEQQHQESEGGENTATCVDVLRNCVLM